MAAVAEKVALEAEIAREAESRAWGERVLPARRPSPRACAQGRGWGVSKAAFFFSLVCHMSDEWGDFRKQGFTLRSVPELGAGAKPPWKAEAGPFAASTGTC